MKKLAELLWTPGFYGQKTLADILLNSLCKFLWMAGHPDKKNDYFIVVKVSLSFQIQNFFDRQN